LDTFYPPGAPEKRIIVFFLSRWLSDFPGLKKETRNGPGENHRLPAGYASVQPGGTEAAKDRADKLVDRDPAPDTKNTRRKRRREMKKLLTVSLIAVFMVGGLATLAMADHGGNQKNAAHQESCQKGDSHGKDGGHQHRLGCKGHDADGKEHKGHGHKKGGCKKGS